MVRSPSRLKAILLAFLVTSIWATSWIFIKIGLREIPALTFAGLRYSLAFLVLLPFLFRKQARDQIKQFTKREWIRFILLGVVLYAMAQGGQFLGLSFLPSVTVGLILNLTSLFVAVMAMITLKEIPRWTQWIGVILNLAGVLIYFTQGTLGTGLYIGFIFAGVSLLANVFGAILGRSVNRTGAYSPLVVTVISMGIGSVLMLAGGIAWQGIPHLTMQSIGIVVLLAIVNTALCFTLWNYILQTLSAMESSIINSTMMVQIAVLAWVFLGEKQSIQGLIGLGLAFIGAIIVNARFPRKRKLIRSDRNSI